MFYVLSESICLLDCFSVCPSLSNTLTHLLPLSLDGAHFSSVFLSHKLLHKFLHTLSFFISRTHTVSFSLSFSVSHTCNCTPLSRSLSLIRGQLFRKKADTMHSFFSFVSKRDCCRHTFLKIVQAGGANLGSFGFHLFPFQKQTLGYCAHFCSIVRLSRLALKWWEAGFYCRVNLNWLQSD